jgi:hypothetical protein
MKKQKTIYHLIVDKSGSMSDCIDNTINGFNEQVTKIKQLQQEFTEQVITIGLTTFNDISNHHFFQESPEAVRLLNRETYRPEGGTALLDAVGQVCEKCERDVLNESDKFDNTVVIVILTDGYENSSRMFRLEEIRRTISRLEATGKWTFSFLGATLDAVDIAESMNIKRHNSVFFNKEEMNTKVWGNLKDSMSSYMNKKRSGGDLGDLFNKK